MYYFNEQYFYDKIICTLDTSDLSYFFKALAKLPTEVEYFCPLCGKNEWKLTRKIRIAKIECKNCDYKSIIPKSDFKRFIVKEGKNEIMGLANGAHA